MNKNVKKYASKLIGTAVNCVSQSRSGGDIRQMEVNAEISRICRKAAADGCVLLKNDGRVLPLCENEKVALFGRCQYDTFYVGYGSGGDVKAHYKISFHEGLAASGKVEINSALDKKYLQWRKKNMHDDGFWGHWPMCYDEMPLSDSDVKSAASDSDTAVLFIGRAAGEDRDNKLTDGSFYLTDGEREMLRLVSSSFSKFAVVLNTGGVFDFSWVEEYKVPCVLIAWQGGMEAGNALADILTGEISPSGCLTDTIAASYEDYPSSESFGGKDFNIYSEDIYVGYRYFETFDKNSVLFEFGKGLSYSEFDIKNIVFHNGGSDISVNGTLLNIGKASGAKVLQLYCDAPCGKLGRPSRQLCGFIKSPELDSAEEWNFSLTVPYYDFSAFDDSALTAYPESYVLEAGEYVFHIGFSVRDTFKAGSFSLDKTVLIEQLDQCAAPRVNFMRLRAYESDGRRLKAFMPVKTKGYDLKERISNTVPSSLPVNVGLDYRLEDVKKGTVTLDEFISSLSYDELEAISRGAYIMNSPLGASGNAGVLGGVTQSLIDKGVPSVTCTDGPSGIRLNATSSLLPCGTALACTWDEALISRLYELVGEEMKERDSNVLLAPGMNIHRDPLCGRNFEYFSEDPLVAGRCAAAVVKGLQSRGVSACPKHFACNNQEYNRTSNDSVLSERALREIYLKGFEICVKTSVPLNIMTSYNKINGVWGHYNYELVTSVLRGEWGYEGSVMTDWWMRSSVSPEFPCLRDQAYRVRAGVDVLMPGGGRTGKQTPDGTLLDSIGKKDGITTGELQNTARHVLNMILNLDIGDNKNENSD